MERPEQVPCGCYYCVAIRTSVEILDRYGTDSPYGDLTSLADGLDWEPSEEDE